LREGPDSIPAFFFCDEIRLALLARAIFFLEEGNDD
jgi:hypothetical protein